MVEDFVIEVHDYESKEKLVTALTDNGYVVTAGRVTVGDKSKIRITVFKKPSPEQVKKKGIGYLG